MSKRPQPKPSGLGAHPLDVAEPVEAAPQKPPKKEYPHKLSFYIDAEDADEVRGAFKAQFSRADGDTSISTFIAGAVQEKVQRLRDELNDGKPFPGIEAGGAGRGRQMGA